MQQRNGCYLALIVKFVVGNGAEKRNKVEKSVFELCILQ